MYTGTIYRYERRQYTRWRQSAVLGLSDPFFPMAAEYSMAPRSTIDVSALKPSRFLYNNQLPYRDERGRITLCLLEEAHMAVDQGLVKAPPEILAKLHKWLKHCRQWAETNTTEWTRDGNAWLSNEGERRAILVSAAGMRRRLNEIANDTSTTPITGAAPSRVKPVIKQPTAKRSKADEAPPARGKRESCHVELSAGAAPPRKAPKRRVLLSSSEEEEEEEEEKMTVPAPATTTTKRARRRPRMRREDCMTTRPGWRKEAAGR